MAANIESAINSHYATLSKEMGYKVLPPEGYINTTAYTFMQNKMYDLAKKLFQMNIENYPKSFNVYDSMGDYYDDRGDKQKAIEYYTKALTLRENPDTRTKLNKLKN